jgi:hypothetical protein
MSSMHPGEQQQQQQQQQCYNQWLADATSFRMTCTANQ